jgi:hypothetical protein
MLQALRHFVAIDHAAPKHFLAACVLCVLGVVEDLHGELSNRGILNMPTSASRNLKG